MDNDPMRELLLKELEQINEHSRVLFQMYIAWLTFFLTLLLGAMATAVKASVKKGKIQNPKIVYFVGLLFAVQITFGLIACAGLYREFNKMDQRVHTINENLVKVSLADQKTSSATYINPESTIPSIMPLSVEVGILTLVSHFLLWGFLVFKIRKWSKTKELVFGDTTD